MKKEKNVNTKELEKDLNTKDLEKNKIKRLRKILHVGEITLMVLPLLRIGMTIVMAILIALSGENVSLVSEMNEMFGTQEIVFSSTQDEILYTIKVVLSCIGYVTNILILNKIQKILKNIEIEETPFTEKNIDVLDSIKKLVIFSFVTMLLGNQFGMNLIPVVVVLALISIFKHGCVLQKEIDETL